MSTAAATAPQTYLRWVLALIGALLLVAAGQVTTIERGQALASPDRQALTLGGIQTLEQSFSTTRPDLVGLELLITPSRPGDTELSIPLRLQYADGPMIDLVSTSVSPSSAEGGAMTIRFSTLIASRDPYRITGTLRLILDIPEIPSSTGPMIAAQKNPTAQGSLVIDGVVQPGLDLVITPLYQRRWADWIWPISAMAAGKPWLLGQPLFYILLVYLYLLALGAGIAALYRARATDSDDA